ncbi:MAG: hypothetical protein QNM02_18425, partial [Acidimicrobiia bacterium]|nr:hypothetical protein [Acidimicrobiia bacterium]
VPGSTTTAALTCQPGPPAADGGALNAASLTSTTTGQDETNDEACNNFDEPSTSWDKTVVDPGATYDAATGEWAIAYDVVVSNTGDGAGEYTLTDELRYGTGVVIGTVTASLDGSTDQTDPTAPGDGVINGSFDGVGDTTVVTGADIVAGATHTWRITVTATIPTPTTGAGACNPDGTTAGGFLNVADITGATSTTPSACAPFSTLELVKIVDSGDGGNADPDDFTLTATGTDTPPAVVQGAGTAIEAVPADTFQLTETDVAGYSLAKIECDTVELVPDQDSNYFIAVGAGDDVKCEFTNDDGVVDLEITKTDDDITAYEGGAPFDYTITVTNIGDRDVDTGEPVTVVDTLPVGLTWVSFPASCVQASQELTCDLDPTDLTADASVVITVTVEADAGTAPGTYTNGVYVTTQDDPVCTPNGECTPPPCGETNNVACEDTPVLDRSIDVSGFTDVCVGEAPYIRYVILPIGFSPPPTQATLTIKDIDGNPIDYNEDGVIDDDDKVVVDTMTGNLLWPGAEVDSEGNAVDWPGWKFENGLWVEDPTDAIYREGLLIDVEINPTATATVSYPPESSACADPTQASADLQIIKTTSATEVLPGQSFTWDMVVTNNGPDEAVSLVITDQVPAPLVLTDAGSSDFDCTTSGNTMTCTKPSLAVGAMGTIQITTLVPAGTQPVSNLVNVADVTAATPDPEPNNNSDASATSIGCVNCLPGTGGEIGGLLRIAVGLLLAGLVLMLVNRRRRPAAATS